MVGTGITDFFDKDNIQRKIYDEFDKYDKSGYYRLSNSARDNLTDLSRIPELQKEQESISKWSLDYLKNQRELNVLTSNRDKNIKSLSDKYDLLDEKKKKLEMYEAEVDTAIQSGYLSGDDLESAIGELGQLRNMVEDITAIMDQSEVYISNYRSDPATIAEHFINITEDDLRNNFTEAELTIIPTLNIPARATIETVKEALATAQGEADKHPLNYTPEQNSAIDNFQTQTATLKDTLSKFKSGKLGDNDYLDLIQAFPMLKERTTDLDIAIKELIDSNLDTLLNILGENVPTDLLNSFNNLATDAKFDTEAITDNISSLKEAYEYLSENPGDVSSDYIKSLKESFGDLNGYESFISTISDDTSTMEEVQNAFSDLTAEYITQQGVLNDLNLSNVDFLANKLNEMGIVNAYNVVLSALGVTEQDYAQIKEYCNTKGIDLINITAGEIESLINMGTVSDSAQQALYYYSLQKALANENILDTSTDIDNLSALVGALGGANTALNTYSYALKSQNLSPETMEILKQNALNEIEKARSISAPKGNKTASVIDFSSGGNFTKSFADNAKSVSNMAKDTADSVKDSVKDAADEAKKALDELVQKFDELGKGHDLRLSLFTDRDDKIQDAIKLLESQGNLVGKAFYEELINSQNKQIQILTQKRSDLENYLNESVSSGKIEAGTEQWFKMTQAVEDTKDEIMKCTTNVEDFQNKINELHWKQFDKFIDRLEGLDSEISNITDILSKKDLVEEDTGEWTKEGLTSLAMYGEAYELAIFRAQQYGQEIQNLSEAYQRGEYSTLEYQEKLQELQDKQWDSIKASQAAKEGIIELNKTRVDAIKKGIEKEISATEELINKKKEALDIEKDAHDFQNTVAEKQEEIYKLQKQLNGLSADDSQEAAAKKKKIQSQLTDKQKELDEIYYDESVDQQKAALDTELENYKADQENKITLLEESLTNEEELIKTSLQTVQDNHTAVYDTLTQLGNEYGIKLSAAIVNPWTESSGALADFSSSFDEKKSHFTTELGNLGKDFEELGKKADETAQKILNMLGQIDQSYKSMDSSANQEPSSPSSGSKGSSGGSSSSGNTSPQKNKDWRRCQIVNSLGKVMGTFSSTEDANDWLSRHNPKNGSGYHIVYYAHGTRHASAGLALVNEQGTEAIFSKTPTGSFHLMNEGDQVFTKQQTDNLYRLSTAAPSLLLSAIASPSLPGTGASLQQHANSPTNIDIKCPVYIQGSVDNQNIKKIQKQIDHSILKAVGQINQSMYKSGVRKV